MRSKYSIMRFKGRRILLSVSVAVVLYIFYGFSAEDPSETKVCRGEPNRAIHNTREEYFGLQLRANVEANGEFYETYT